MNIRNQPLLSPTFYLGKCFKELHRIRNMKHKDTRHSNLLVPQILNPEFVYLRNEVSQERDWRRSAFFFLKPHEGLCITFHH